MKTSDIYWGAIPWVVLQVILVVDRDPVAGLGDLLDRQGAATIDPSKIKIEIPQIDLPPIEFDQPTIAAALAAKKNGPGAIAPGPFAFESDQPRECADHEGVVAVLRDLEPLIAVRCVKAIIES